MNKKLLTGILSAIILSTSFGFSVVADAHQVKKAPEKQPMMQREGQRPNRPPQGFRRPRMTPEQMIEMTSQRFGYEKSVLERLVAEGTNARDLGMICGYAKTYGKSLEEVAALRKTMTVGRIDHALGITAEMKAQKALEMQAEGLVNDNIVSKPVATKLLASGYTTDDIKFAHALSLRSTAKLENILKLKVAANTWQDVAKKVGVGDADYSAIAEKIRVRPARKSGPGFSSIHFKKIDKDLVTRVYHDNYLFSAKEIGKYCDAGVSFGELDVMCLYAYLANKPLDKVMAMRNKLTAEQIKLKLGLTPQVYHDKVIKYQARRLQERIGLDAKVTEDYMMRGYAMHHVAVAHLVAPMCGKTFDEVLAAKVPSERWTVVAERLGLTQEQYKTVTDRISWEFKNKYE